MSYLMIPGAQSRMFSHGSLPFYAAGGNSPAPLTKSNPKLILHTTEGTGWTNYDQGAKAPNFTINPWTKQCQQHIPLNYGSRALRGSVAINASGVQVEIVGCTVKAWAAQIKRPDLYIGNFGDDEYAYLAKVFADVQRLTGIPNVTTVAWPLAAATKGDETYGNTKWRLSLSQWNAARGFVGHLHAPGNVHSDPGCLDVSRLIRAIDALTPKPSPSPSPAPSVFVPCVTLTKGSVGVHVTNFQRLGIDRYHSRILDGHGGADGVFGDATVALAKAIQNFHNRAFNAGLVIDGVVGPATQKAMFAFTKTNL